MISNCGSGAHGKVRVEDSSPATVRIMEESGSISPDVCQSWDESTNAEDACEAGLGPAESDMAAGSPDVKSKPEPAAGPESVPEAVPGQMGSDEILENTVLDPNIVSGLAPGSILMPGFVDRDRFDEYFIIYEISEGDPIYERIIGRSYVPNDYIGLEDLRYLKLFTLQL